MKKISMMKTMSSIGVMLISASSSRDLRLRIDPVSVGSVMDEQVAGLVDLGLGP
jgi:hypothetical protein